MVGRVLASDGRVRSVVRYGMVAALLLLAAQVAPDVWAVDRATPGIAWFEWLTMALALVKILLAWRVSYAEVRARVLLAVGLGFAAMISAMLAFSTPSLLLVGLAGALAATEWPR